MLPALANPSSIPAPPTTAIELVDAVPAAPTALERGAIRVGMAAAEPAGVGGLGVGAVLALGAWVAGAPWLTPWLIVAGVAWYGAAIVRGARRLARDERARGPLAFPLLPEVQPEEIASSELRATYAGILRLHEDIRCSLLEAARMQTVLRATFDRCGEVARVAGRLARLANPLDRYLRYHGASQVSDDVKRLAAFAGDSNDRGAQAAYREAVSARGRQLATLLEIQVMHERIRARLALISASLESVAAMVIKLQILDLEQVELAGDSMTEQLAALGDELAVLDSTLQASVE